MSDPVYAIRAEKLTKRFGDFTAVNEITFDVKQGEIYGFLGANGAGKTTAIRMLIGLLSPTSGMLPSQDLMYSKKRKRSKKVSVT